jgi:hypothetical protein
MQYFGGTIEGDEIISVCARSQFSCFQILNYKRK